MAQRPLKGSSTRLGTQFRGKLAAEYGHRGVAPNSLWYVYSPRTRSDWVLRSDLEWDHFIMAESDARIAACNYRPERPVVNIGGKSVDAIVTYNDGSIEWRHIRAGADEPAPAFVADQEHDECVSAAKAAGCTYVVWSEGRIRHNQILLANWRRVVAWLAAARDHSLAMYQEELAMAIRAEGHLTLGQIEAQFGEASFALYAAAAFSELQRGRYRSDLDNVHLSRHTVIQLQ